MLDPETSGYQYRELKGHGFSYDDTKQALYDIITTAYKLNHITQGTRYGAGLLHLINKTRDLVHNVFVDYKSNHSRLADIHASLPAAVIKSINMVHGSMLSVVDKQKLFKELYSNIRQYIQDIENRYIEQLSYIIPTNDKVITAHRQIKTLYNILESHGTYLSPKIKQMSLISAKYTL